MLSIKKSNVAVKSVLSLTLAVVLSYSSVSSAGVVIGCAVTACASSGLIISTVGGALVATPVLASAKSKSDTPREKGSKGRRQGRGEGNSHDGDYGALLDEEGRGRSQESGRGGNDGGNSYGSDGSDYGMRGESFFTQHKTEVVIAGIVLGADEQQVSEPFSIDQELSAREELQEYSMSEAAKIASELRETTADGKKLVVTAELVRKTKAVAYENKIKAADVLAEQLNVSSLTAGYVLSLFEN